MATLAPEIVQKIREVNTKTYNEQAVWFLNAFFHELTDAQKEEIYVLQQDFAKADHENKAKGNELNAVQSFNLLQKRNQTLTALELKAQLRKVDIDANGEMSALEFYLFNFNKDPVACATRPQGSASEEEQAKLDAVQKQVDDLSKIFDELSAAQAAAEKALEEVKAAEEEARVIEAEIKAQEQAKINEMARLEALTQDQSVGIVKRNMAVQQLATLKNEDSLPLQKAKLTQEAVVRKLARAVKASEEATAKATAAAEAAAAQLKAAEAEFQLLKQTMSGIAHGSVWMLERELAEKKKYLPQRLQ